MRTYFINTDAKSNKGRSLHSEWLRRGVAVTSGAPKYRDDLVKFNPGDRLLMYVNGEGVMAVGYVENGEVLDIVGDGKVNPHEPIEYHRRVRWTNNLTRAPVTLRELENFLFIPHSAVTPIAQDNYKLPLFLAAIDKRSSAPGHPTAGMLTPDRAIAALRTMSQRCQVDEMTETARSQQFYFEPPSARSLLVSKDLHEAWVRIYINRQSRKLEWFPVGSASAHFRGVEVGYRYLRGHKGAPGRPGIAASAAKISTLNPLDNHVLLLHCSDEQGFRELVSWYAGLTSLGPGHPPSPLETSGEGPWVPAEKTLPSNEATEPRGAITAAAPSGFDRTGAAHMTGQNAQPEPTDALEREAAEAGTGWMSDPVRRSAVELHAVKTACAWYRDRNFQVEVLGKPFDLLCVQRAGPGDEDDEVIHVEVKGSVGKATTVRLTRNEVKDARDRAGWRSDLFVISEIELLQSAAGTWTARGGKQRWYKDWYPRDEDLVPTEFEYRLPE